VQDCPSAFTPFLNDFFVKGMDPSFTRMIKLDILVSLCIDPSAIDAVLSELRSYVRHNDKSFACAAIIAVGKVAELARIVYDRRAFTGGIDAEAARDESNSIALGCLSGLVTLSEFSKNGKVVGKCVETIQQILAQLWSKDGGFGSSGGEGDVKSLKDPALIQERVLKRLLLIFIRSISVQDDEPGEEETDKNRLVDRAVAVPPSATASLLWTISEWFTMSGKTLTWDMDSSSKSKIRVEVLRLLAKEFPRLDAQIKLQALHLASKVFLMNKSDHGSSSAEESSLSEFILAMGRADVMQDVRDRARYESNVLHLSAGLNGDTSLLQQRPSSNCMNVDKARKVLLNRKPAATSLPLDGKEFGSAKHEIDIFRFGSLSSIVGLKAGGSSLPLPDWALVNSSSSLRDPEVVRQKKAAEDEADLYDDDSSSSSSSDDETTSSDDSSSSDGSSDESSDSDSEEEGDVNNMVIERNGVAAKPIPASTQVSNDLLPSMINNEGVDSSSSASSSSDDSSDTDSDDSLEGETDAQHQPVAEGTLFELPADTINTTQASKPQYVKETSIGSSVASGLEGLVMSPLVVNKNDTNMPSNIDDDSGLWKPLVRPELSGGLCVKMRFIFGQSRAKEVAALGLDPTNPSTVCLQVHIENMRTDVGAIRHVRIVHRRGASGGTISPSKVILPPEISVLKKGQTSTASIGITFESASDRDGLAVAKFDVKSDRGSTSIDIRPSIGEMLDTPPKNIDFDAATAGFEGNKFLMISSPFSLSPISDEKFKSVPTKILKHLFLRQIGEWPDKGCFVGKLPESGDHVFIRVQCDSVSGAGKITVCGNNAMASNSIANLVKSSLSD
jgi:AP-3 complex subunit beta